MYFADDTSILHAHRNLHQLVSNWLQVNKVTLNFKESNYMILRPYQKLLSYLSFYQSIYDPILNKSQILETKSFVKYLAGILINLGFGSASYFIVTLNMQASIACASVWSRVKALCNDGRVVSTSAQNKSEKLKHTI